MWTNIQIQNSPWVELRCFTKNYVFFGRARGLYIKMFFNTWHKKSAKHDFGRFRNQLDYIYAIMSQNYIKSIQKCKKYKRYLLIAWIKFGNIKDDQAFCI